MLMDQTGAARSRPADSLSEKHSQHGERERENGLVLCTRAMSDEALRIPLHSFVENRKGDNTHGDVRCE